VIRIYWRRRPVRPGWQRQIVYSGISLVNI
jgi:hypothetical protein